MKKYRLNLLLDEKDVINLNLCGVLPGYECVGCPRKNNLDRCINGAEALKKLLEYGWISEVEVKE